MCAHEDDAIMHEPKASALCDRVHYCIIRVCHINRRNVSWAGSKCFISGHMTSDQLASELFQKLAERLRRLARYLVS